MVKNNIQDHFDTVAIQIFDQVFQLIPFPVEFFFGCITGVRGKKAYRIISPVVQKSPAVNLSLSPGFIELKNRH